MGVDGSPTTQTLAELKQKAIKDRGKKKRKPTGKSKVKNPRKAVKRFSRIMREEHFEGMSWTRTFVSGPMDPKWNRYKFHWLVCKGNVSIYRRGVIEILRHYATERHLREDQRWRYEYMGIEDPVTKTIRHQVRGRDDKILSPYELELEYPKFKDAELVDSGEKLPFYEEFIAGNDHMTSSYDNRVRLQISVLGHFLAAFGNIGSLRSFGVISEWWSTISRCLLISTGGKSVYQ